MNKQELLTRLDAAGYLYSEKIEANESGQTCTIHIKKNGEQIPIPGVTHQDGSQVYKTESIFEVRLPESNSKEAAEAAIEDFIAFGMVDHFLSNNNI